MDRVTMIDLARATATDVRVQWTGVDINWSDVRAELDAHWANEILSRDDEWTAHDENEFRNLVARELERSHLAKSGAQIT